MNIPIIPGQLRRHRLASDVALVLAALPEKNLCMLFWIDTLTTSWSSMKAVNRYTHVLFDHP